MWKQVGKVIIAIVAIAILVSIGGIIGSVGGLIIGVIYLPVKILSLISENCSCGGGGGDEI